LIDLIQKELNHGGGGFVYVVNDLGITNSEMVLKLILLGAKNSESRNTNK
jgi:hypothetical protein